MKPYTTRSSGSRRSLPTAMRSRAAAGKLRLQVRSLCARAGRRPWGAFLAVEPARTAEAAVAAGRWRQDAARGDARARAAVGTSGARHGVDVARAGATREARLLGGRRARRR